MIRDYRDIELTVERPTPIDKEVVWDKSKVIISETDVYGRNDWAAPQHYSSP